MGATEGWGSGKRKGSGTCYCGTAVEEQKTKILQEACDEQAEGATNLNQRLRVPCETSDRQLQVPSEVDASKARDTGQEGQPLFQATPPLPGSDLRRYSCRPCPRLCSKVSKGKGNPLAALSLCPTDRGCRQRLEEIGKAG